jgi:hypothetical protein
MVASLALAAASSLFAPYLDFTQYPAPNLHPRRGRGPQPAAMSPACRRA